MRKSKGNMFDFVDYTWNVVKGKCPHKCEYCYMLVYPQKELYFADFELKTNLGNENFIFVGSSCDMFAESIPEEWILKILEHCKKFDNKYLFQSKNPERIFNLMKYLPKNCVIGTTIESDRKYKSMGETPSPTTRAIYMKELHRHYETMITIEPIHDFDIIGLTTLIKISNPSWVNIGADSKNHSLPEPNKDKILELIYNVSKFTEIKKKSNLERLLKS